MTSVCACPPGGGGEYCYVNPTCNVWPVECDDDNPCTIDFCTPAIGCLHKPLTAVSCQVGTGCGSCQSGVCVPTAGLSAAPLLDIQLPESVTLWDVTPTSDGDMIAFGSAKNPATDAYRAWIARFGSDGKLAWQSWPAPTLKGYDHLAARLSNGDVLLKVRPDGNEEYVFVLVAKTGAVLKTGFPSPTYQPAESSTVVLDAVLSDDSLLRVRVKAEPQMGANTEYAFKTVETLQAYLDGSPSPTWATLAQAGTFGNRFQFVGGHLVWLEAIWPMAGMGAYCYLCGKYSALTAIGPPSASSWANAGSYDGAGSLLEVQHLDSAPNGTLVAWGRRLSNAQSGGGPQPPAAAWLNPVTGAVEYWRTFDVLPFASAGAYYESLPDFSAVILPTSGIALLDQGELAWTDAQGNVLGDVVLSKSYAGMKLFTRWPDGSIGLWSAHRIVRLPFQWAGCP